MAEPSVLYVNGSATWTRDNSDYSPAGGYSLEYVLVKAGSRIVIDGSMVVGSGSRYTVTIAPSDSSGWEHGAYSWTAYAVKSGERWAVAAGGMTVVPDFPSAASGYDARSHVKITLDALEALIEGRAADGLDQVSIRGRSITRMGMGDLLKWRSQYQRWYEEELDAAAVADGDSPRSVVRVRFTGE